MRISWGPIACAFVVSCAGTQLTDRDRFAQSLRDAPEMIAPSGGKVDPNPAGNWDSTFRMISYSEQQACFLAQWSVPPDWAPSLHFKLSGWRSLEDSNETAPFVTSTSVEVLSAELLAKVEHYDGYYSDRAKMALIVARPDKEQTMYDTAMRVCFPSPRNVLASAKYLAITVEADHHRTGAGWRLVMR
jgi:hypothetical protein